jgi:hypothetical protein
MFAAKALVAAFVAFLSPVCSYLVISGGWSWRAFAASCISGLIAGGTTYAVPNAPRSLPQHAADLNNSHSNHMEG